MCVQYTSPKSNSKPRKARYLARLAYGRDFTAAHISDRRYPSPPPPAPPFLRRHHAFPNSALGQTSPGTSGRLSSGPRGKSSANPQAGRDWKSENRLISDERVTAINQLGIISLPGSLRMFHCTNGNDLRPEFKMARDYPSWLIVINRLPLYDPSTLQSPVVFFPSFLFYSVSTFANEVPLLTMVTCWRTGHVKSRKRKLLEVSLLSQSIERRQVANVISWLGSNKGCFSPSRLPIAPSALPSHPLGLSFSRILFFA